MGWTFATWKLYENDNVGILDQPAKLYSLQDVAQAGLFPDLTNEIPAQDACLNPPLPDFTLGDDTLAPTMGPPPDCGNGWWNYTTSQCDYWIPPPEPSPSPTAACPVCDACGAHASLPMMAKAATGGAVFAAAIILLVSKFCFRNNKGDYTPIPNAQV